MERGPGSGLQVGDPITVPKGVCTYGERALKRKETTQATLYHGACRESLRRQGWALKQGRHSKVVGKGAGTKNAWGVKREAHGWEWAGNSGHRSWLTACCYALSVAEAMSVIHDPGSCCQT